MKQFPKHIIAVGGVVENGMDEILLVKTHRGWEYPGGQVENGENLVAALIREIEEESGIIVNVNRIFWIGSNTSTSEGYNGYEQIPTKLCMSFICKAIGGSLRTSDETSDVRWVKKHEVADYITNKLIYDRFKIYLDFCGEISYHEYKTNPEYKIHYECTL